MHKLIQMLLILLVNGSFLTFVFQYEIVLLCFFNGITISIDGEFINNYFRSVIISQICNPCSAQVLLIFGIFNNDSNKNVSVFFVVLNLLFQILGLRTEAPVVREPFSQYCLECLMAGISWVSFNNQIANYSAGNNGGIVKNKYIV